jgi:tetratricopeptide (TPR) repeat protein
MFIDRRYRGRKKRSPWPFIFMLAIILIPGVYLLATRTRFFENPFNPLAPTATPTRSAVSYLADAEDAYNAGLFAKAAESYGQMLALEPDNHRTLNRMAWLWILRGHPEEAVPLAQRAVDVEANAENLSMLAMAQDWSGDYDEAIKTALKAVDADPLSAIAHATLGEVYADRNNWQRALDEARQAEELDPNSFYVIRNLGYVLSMQGRSEEALEAYAKAVALDPKYGYINISAGNIYMILSDYNAAIEQFEKAVEVNPDIPTGYDALGHASALNGDPDRGKAMLRKAIELDPEYAPAHAHLGRLYYTQLNWESAIESFNTAFQLGLKNEEYFYELGLAYSYLEDCPNGIRWFEKALELNPDSKPAKDGIRRCQK